MKPESPSSPVVGLEQTLPSSWYYSEDTFALEKERIFCREWYCAAREEELPEPGDYRVLDIVGESILLVRNRQGILRGFYNVCRHHAAAVAMSEGPAAGLQLLDALETKSELRDYYLLPAARGDLLRRLQQWSDSANAYRRALSLSTNEAERRVLSRRLAEAESKA